MNITHHKNGEIKTLVEEAPYHPGYEDAGFKPKAVSNEPIAFVTGVRQFDTKYADNVLKVGTPLYTHPVKEPMMVLDGNRVYPAFKELTDEEIIEVHVKTPFIDGYLNKNLIEFARAILRKAQEK